MKINKSNSLAFVRLIAFYELSNKLFYVGLENIVILESDLQLITVAPIELNRGLIPKLKKRVTKQSTKKFLFRLQELGSKRLGQNG